MQVVIIALSILFLGKTDVFINEYSWIENDPWLVDHCILRDYIVYILKTSGNHFHSIKGQTCVTLYIIIGPDYKNHKIVDQVIYVPSEHLMGMNLAVD